MATLAIFTIVKSDNTAITLSADQTAAPFVGYHLIDYGPQIGEADIARGGSPYADGTRIANQRYGNVVEQYRLDIVGSSPDDAIAKLADLYRLVYWARDLQFHPGLPDPPVIAYSIPGTTKSGSAFIYGGSISETTQTPRLQAEGNRIKGIILTIERTRWFLSTGNFPTIPAIKSSAVSALWGLVPFDGSANAVIPGDVPARVALSLNYNPGSATNIGRAVFGYASERRMRAVYGSWTVPTTPTVLEAENFTTRTNYVLGASAGASPGAGNTYAGSTGTPATLVGSVSFNGGSWRAFARLQVSAGGAASVSLKVAAGSFIISQFAPVSVSANQWRMYDLGVVTSPTAPHAFGGASTPESLTLTVAADISAGQLFVDCLVMIPCGEYYLDMRLATNISGSGPTMRYRNIEQPYGSSGAYLAAGGYTIYTAAQIAGEMYFPPGKGVLYWLAGDVNFANTFTAAGTDVLLSVSYAAQYETAPSS